LLQQVLPKSSLTLASLLSQSQPTGIQHAEVIAEGAWIPWKFPNEHLSHAPAIAIPVTLLATGTWLVGIALLFALPVGTGAAVYLQEYAPKNWFTKIIQTNINNLAGVPSIVYGMLGLALFVRVMEPLTSGAMFGVSDSNGRTVLAAGLTMGILVLPLIIINAQEAIKAVPDSLRQAAYGVGATRWQTVKRGQLCLMGTSRVLWLRWLRLLAPA